MKILFAAGGSGGHILPAIAVAQALKRLKPEVQILFVGSGAQLEEKLVGGAGFTLRVVRFVPFVGKGVGGALKVLLLLPRARWQTFLLIRKELPALVAGFGGYPSVLPGLVAKCKGLSCIIQEQNAEVGLANRLLGLVADRVFAVNGAAGFWGTRSVSHLANPVREDFSDIPAWQMPGGDERLRILIVGGSQGAVSLNTAVLSLLDLLDREDVEIVHQTGAFDYERVSSSYRALKLDAAVEAFFDDMPGQYARAHLVICRAGAMTVAEVSAAGRPAIFVPLAIARGHQRKNCEYLVEKGAAFVIEQGPQTERELRALVSGLLEDRRSLEAMAHISRRISREGGEMSAITIARQILGLIDGHG